MARLNPANFRQYHPPKVELPTEQAYVLSPYRWHARSKKWEPQGAAPAEPCESLKMVTYNVWFSDYHRLSRNRALLDILQASDADIICLQEVLPDLVTMLCEEPWVRAKYSLSDVTGRTVVPYGVLMLSKHPMDQLVLYPLRSEMSRHLLVAAFNFGGEQIAVGTVHLESLNSAPFRKEQLQIAEWVMRDFPTSYLMGDFNFCSRSNYDGSMPLENEVLRAVVPEYTDIWEDVHPDVVGFTFDTTLNTMIASQPTEHARYDRIILRSELWKARTIDIIGDEAIPDSTGRGDAVLPSDHFGLITICTPD